MIIKFWGTRGSVPVPGQNTVKYGGNTPCVELRTDDNHLIILDAGTGIRELGKSIINEKFKNHIDIFISHYHWDHIQGIPFFLPLYEKDYKITFYGQTSNGIEIETLLKSQMARNFFPIEIGEIRNDLNFRKINSDSSYSIGGSVLKTFMVKHSSPTLTFKIEQNGKNVVYMTDNELNFEIDWDKNNFDELKKKYRDLIEFCRGADYLIHDAMYDQTLLEKKKGWGHSSNISVAYFALAAEVSNLIPFHYNPDYSDVKIDGMVGETVTLLKQQKSTIKCIAAREGLTIKI
jgi:phosphoribosyl 1,2-cyclic phosphodiesterase